MKDELGHIIAVMCGFCEKKAMDKQLLHILQHSLGLGQYGQGKQYRNHFVAGDDDAEKCRELVGMGFMTEHRASELTGGRSAFPSDAGRH